MARFAPPGFAPGQVQHRFVEEFGSSGPLSFDRESRSVDAVLSRGSPVQRVYGTEILRISPSAVNLDRVASNSVPLLDSHRQDGINAGLGRIARAWFDGGALLGKLKFNRTPQGEQAMNMVARGEISSLSAGYRTDEWLIRDSDGNEIDPEVDRVRWDDELTFTATKWQLLEASLVLVPADDSASIRSLGGGNPIADVRARMVARTRMMRAKASMMIGLRCSAATSMNDSKPVTGVRSAPVSEPGGSLVARKASDCIGPPTMLGEQAATAFGIESNGSGGRESLMPRSAADDERIAIHEAGHAVAARLLGHEVGGVTVNPGPGYQGLCWGVGHHEAFTNGRGDASNVREVLAPLMPKPGEDRVSVSDVFGNVHAQCLQLLAGRAAERMLLEGEPAMPADDLRQARELALLICSSEEAIETFIAHCDVAARDLLFPHGDAVIVLSTVLRIKRTLDGAEIDGLISDLQARKALAAERVRRKRWEGVIENAARLVAD